MADSSSDLGNPQDDARISCHIRKETIKDIRDKVKIFLLVKDRPI